MILFLLVGLAIISVCLIVHVLGTAASLKTIHKDYLARGDWGALVRAASVDSTMKLRDDIMECKSDLLAARATVTALAKHLGLRYVPSTSMRVPERFESEPEVKA